MQCIQLDGGLYPRLQPAEIPEGKMVYRTYGKNAYLRLPFPEKTSYTTTYDLTKYYDLSKLTKGKYRLYLDYSVVPDVKCYVEFKL